ncbi:MAG: hypothetical protein KIS87_13600 [Phycisphaeraceae bacterium]|nr:hypothetical protein [Phycisphaeraceae bacterium]
MSKVNEAARILEALGLPKAQTNERSALTLLALAGVKPRTAWTKAAQPLLRTVDIMEFMRRVYRKDYAPNSRETIRRSTLHQFIEARIVDLNPDEPDRPTNSGNNRYALTDAALRVLRAHGSPQFDRAVSAFISEQGRLQDLYRRRRSMTMVSVTLPSGKEIALSPGRHNNLQRAVIEQFGPRFAPGARLLYLGDTARKHVVFEERLLRRFGIAITEHDKLPDVVLHHVRSNWVYFIEAVVSHGPVNPIRKAMFEGMLAKSKAEPIFVSAFTDRNAFRRWLPDIAWETEVWIASDPDHLIHFNGHKFLGPHSDAQT